MLEVIHNPSGYLTDHLLIAAPGLQDSCFSKALVYICAHNESGAMGVIVNSVIDSVRMDEVLEQLDVQATEESKKCYVHFGGPVEVHRGLLIHSDDVVMPESLINPSGITLSANLELLKKVAEGCGPKHAILSLGYSGWTAGQLEAEIESGSWITLPASRKLVFETANTMKWNTAAATLGVDLTHFSDSVGHA